MNQAGNSYLPDLNKANRFPETRASWLPIFQLSRNPNFSNNCFHLKHCELEHSYPEFYFPSPPLVDYGFWHEKANFNEAKRSLKKSCFSNILLLYIIFYYTMPQCLQGSCREQVHIIALTHDIIKGKQNSPVVHPEIWNLYLMPNNLVKLLTAACTSTHSRLHVSMNL